MDFPSLFSRGSVSPHLSRLLRKTPVAIVALLSVSLLIGGAIGLARDTSTSSAAAIEPSSEATPESTPESTPDSTPEPGPSESASAQTETTQADTTQAAIQVASTRQKPKAPKPATRERKAKNIPAMPLDKNTGRRIVYDKALMTVWAMDENNEVVYRFPVVGRWDRPVAGEYKVFSHSPRSGNPNSKVTFDHMTRFAFGMDGKSAIGFHSIPKYYDGSMMHAEDQLGLPIATGGCVRMAAPDAKKLYKWADVGDTVIVLESP